MIESIKYGRFFCLGWRKTKNENTIRCQMSGVMYVHKTKKTGVVVVVVVVSGGSFRK
jgi:hypothetical protein